MLDDTSDFSGGSQGPSEPSLTLAHLADHRRWVAWQKVTLRPGDKPRKVPYNPRAGGPAKVDDPTTWGTRAEAEALAAKLPKPFGEGGVGIVLGEVEGSPTLGGTDGDSCLGEEGEIADWALEVRERMNSYTEVSPSGTGEKTFFTWNATDGVTIRRAMDTDTGKKWTLGGAKGEHAPGIEVYISGRWFAVTDEHVEGTPSTLNPVSTDDLLWLIHEAGPALKARGKDEAPPKAKAKASRPPGEHDEGDVDAAPQEHAQESTRESGGEGDGTCSAAAFRIALKMQDAKKTIEEYAEVLEQNEETKEWYYEKGIKNDNREVIRAWYNAGKFVAERAWVKKCHKDGYGNPRPSLHNALLGLRLSPKYRNLLGYDEMLGVPMLMTPIPRAFTAR